jgi:hypothetical protein
MYNKNQASAPLKIERNMNCLLSSSPIQIGAANKELAMED